MTDLLIRTTLTLDSSKQHFGPPGAIDYRAHPGDNKDEDPVVIFKSMVNKGVSPVADVRHMKSSIYSFKNRKIITRWLRDVCAAFRLKSTTLCLSIQLTDAFLLGNLQTVPIGSCQLAAVTCLWIAAKFEEMDGDLPSLQRIVDVCDRAYSAEDVIDMEESVLSHFKWRLPHTTLVNHLYLQIHLLSNETLVKSVASDRTADDNIVLSLLTVDPDSKKRVWVKRVHMSGSTKLKAALPKLCTLVGIQPTNSIDVYQLFGRDFLIAQRKDLNVCIGQLPLDENGEVRLFPSPTKNQVTSIFVERGGYTILRSVNYTLLDLSDALIQEVVTYVEFLKLPSFTNALGVLALALCVSPSADAAECYALVQHILKSLSISATHSLAAADFLAGKVVAAGSATFPTPPSDIRERLAACFDRPLPQERGADER